ncbi:MAG: hypothetical protein ACQCN6_05910 [Candidatus Bathyarchaeia archaeon]|jgi:hypothetical protein
MRLGRAEIALLVAVAFLAASIVLGAASRYPLAMDTEQSSIIIDDTFHLSPNEIWRQGLGAFTGGENITVSVSSSEVFSKNFSIIAYNGLRYNTTEQSFTYTFTAGADYYEAIFNTSSSQAGTVHFEVSVLKPEVAYSYSWLSMPARVLFFLSVATAMLIILKSKILKQFKSAAKPFLPSINRINRQKLLAFVVLSLVVWLAILAFNPNPLGTFENWYTDHARHPYVSSLFLKDGISIFNQPLGILASHDNSRFMYVTWPEMPHLYPLGSVALFLPFGALLQNSVDPLLVFKLEIVVFLVFAHVCLYFFLKYLLKKDMHLFWRLVGVYIIYVSLIIYAADGMFDSVAFFFSLMAVTMFLTERYDGFFLLMTTSILFKYQAGIFLLPFILVGVVMLLQNNKLSCLARNKSVLLGIGFVGISGFTAFLSLPYLIQTRPELVMNGIDAFIPNAQIPWMLQTTAVLITLAGTLIYTAYMLNKNSFLSLSAIFLLFPSFTLPYFQNWYLPFLFVYILVPQKKKELEATMIWLIFMILVLSFGGSAFNPLGIIQHFQSMINL